METQFIIHECERNPDEEMLHFVFTTILPFERRSRVREKVRMRGKGVKEKRSIKVCSGFFLG